MVFALFIVVVSYNLCNSKDEVYTYIEKTYGFSDEVVYAKYTASVTRDGNKSVVKDKNYQFKDDSRGGAIYYKNIEREDLEQLICVHLNETTYNNISVSCTIREKDKQGNTQSKTINLAMPHLKSRCYVTVKENRLIVVELAEKMKAG